MKDKIPWIFIGWLLDYIPFSVCSRPWSRHALKLWFCYKVLFHHCLPLCPMTPCLWLTLHIFVWCLNALPNFLVQCVSTGTEYEWRKSVFIFSIKYFIFMSLRLLLLLVRKASYLDSIDFFWKFLLYYQKYNII